MVKNTSASTHPPNFVIVRIINRLETHGINPKSYQLYNVVDPDDLVALVDTGNATDHITFHLRGLAVTVYGTADVDIE